MKAAWMKQSTSRIALGVILIIWSGRLSGEAWGAPTEGGEPFTVRLVHPDRQVAEILRLFEGSRGQSRGGLDRLEAVDPGHGRLGKPLEAVIAMFNPEMVREWRILDRRGASPGPRPRQRLAALVRDRPSRRRDARGRRHGVPAHLSRRRAVAGPGSRVDGGATGAFGRTVGLSCRPDADRRELACGDPSRCACDTRPVPGLSRSTRLVQSSPG